MKRFTAHSGRPIFAASVMACLSHVSAWAETPEILFRQAERAYLLEDAKAFESQVQAIASRKRSFTQDQLRAIEAMHRDAAQRPPAWWAAAQQTKDTRFDAEIWGRTVRVKYEPAAVLGYQGLTLHPGRRRIEITLSWDPKLLSSDRMLEGALATQHRLRERDLGEAIAWHEIGHLYVTRFLPYERVVALYQRDRRLFRALLELYADLTTMVHAGPRARRALMLYRLNDLDRAEAPMTANEPHARAALAVGSLWLETVLADPDQWPSVHFPPAVPDADVARAVITYMLATLPETWTFAEDQAWRSLAMRWVREEGDKALADFGRVALSAEQVLQLDAALDVETRTRRDARTADRLDEMIRQGRTDSVAADTTARITPPRPGTPPEP